MTIAVQEIWYLAFAGLGIFELIKSRGKSWMPIFCVLSGAAVLLENVEGAVMLTFGFFMLLLQNLQVQQSQTESHLRTQKVILGVIGGLIFLASSLKGDIVGFVSLLLFIFIITTDWPFAGVLKSKQDEDVVETNAKALIYVPISLLISNTFVPNQEWIAYVFFGFSFILFWGKDKDRGLFLLFCGISWLKPELRALAPAITVLCLGSHISSLVLQLVVGYLAATVLLPLDIEVAMGVLGVLGLFVGWMLADTELPQFNKGSLKEKARDLVYLSVSILTVVIAALFVLDAEKTLLPQPEYLIFLGVAVAIEILKRNVRSLKKIQFKKSFSSSVQDLFGVIPVFRTQEREEFQVDGRGAGNYLLFMTSRLRHLESGVISIGLFAAILWSVVIWYYCNT